MTLTFKMREANQRIGLNNLCLMIKTHYINDNNLQLVEIGSYCGESSEIIATHFPNSILNCVDPYEKYTEEGSTYDLNKQELELKEAEQIFTIMMSRHTNIRKNKMPSVKYADQVKEESIDFVYIDGNHQYASVIEDLEVWNKKIKLGGIIAGHDFNWGPVSKAIYEFFGRPPVSVFEDNSWFYIKK
jgi:predicted O-methyltransferase YrrM